MKVVQRINEIIKERGITKRELAKRLINLDMKAHKTGEIPTESSIYAYLNGNIDIKADMMPYIAEALGVSEQELFSTARKNASKNKLDIINNKQKQDCINQQESPNQAKWGGVADNNLIDKAMRYREILELLDYISPRSIEILKSTLQEHRQRANELAEIIKKL